MAKIVDVHSHVYTPSYIALLRTRKEVPFIRTFADIGDRLIILPGEDESPSRGRPVGPSYWDINEKLAFMDSHSISTSVISLANPWLDFLAPAEATEQARLINGELDQLCSQHAGRLYAFAVLPLSATASAIEAEIQHISSLKHMRGVIMGTTGLGSGLDDPLLDIVYAALEKHELPIFLHPHYGLPSAVYGPRADKYGHVLSLALGFPLETTIAVTRMYLSGVFDRSKTLQVLLAHSGGTLPFLAGRIESCLEHDGYLLKEGKLNEEKRALWDVLRKNIYLDAVIYSEVGLQAAVAASGAERIMFGTDHPFFPPLRGEEEWLSARLNRDAIKNAFGSDNTTANNVLGDNAIRILKLHT
ncbi:amidohydrolase 2 [Rhizodiscina lignyota]|uniref:Amidohydrolase 2 n=1 Tax=Rhizodiscina lignyota TaxID=1504668 RepID=A0A9P4MEG3_9PEZI|nr:amidohydrolase 2 [Rhizodiscina lignyota]